MKDSEKYSWFNPEARGWLRREVEYMMLQVTSPGAIMVTCKKCQWNTAVDNLNPFGIDHIVDFMVNEFQAMEMKHNINRLKKLCITAFGKDNIHDPREAHRSR